AAGSENTSRGGRAAGHKAEGPESPRPRKKTGRPPVAAAQERLAGGPACLTQVPPADPDPETAVTLPVFCLASRARLRETDRCCCRIGRLSWSLSGAPPGDTAARCEARPPPVRLRRRCEEDGGADLMNDHDHRHSLLSEQARDQDDIDAFCRTRSSQWPCPSPGSAMSAPVASKIRNPEQPEHGH